MQNKVEEKLPIKVAFEYLRSKGLAHTQKDVGDKMGVSKENISRAFNGAPRYLTGSFVKRFNESYGGIFNETWLLSGGGDMLVSTSVRLPVIESTKPSSITKPRIPYDAAAGTLTDAVEGVTTYQCEQLPVISAFPSYDFTIRVTGKSMEPEFYAGDEVACMRVNGKSFLQWGRVHVLDTTQGVVIKRIYDDGDCIRCKSYNPEFPDFSIPKSEIRSYNLVVGSLRL